MTIRIVRTGDLKDLPFKVLETIEVKHHRKSVYALRCRDDEGEFYLPVWSAAYKVVCKALNNGNDAYWTVDENKEGIPYIKQISRKEAIELLKKSKKTQED
jgi:hypothetical protein